MRLKSVSGVIAGGLVLAPLGLGVPAQAQQRNPSASQIIQSLTPSGDLSKGSTRGIRLANPDASTGNSPAQEASPTQATSPARTEAPSGPAPARPRMAATSHPSGTPSVNLNVDFTTGSAELTPSARDTLDQLGQALSSQQLSGYRFRIVGHTDTVGSPAGNKALSERRAQAVASYLEQKFSLPANRLQALGVGERGLLVPTPPQTPNERNRRVEVINLGA